MFDVLIVSGGNAEDLIGATLSAHLGGLRLAALPLVGAGKRYEGVAAQILGPRTVMPSGGFPFNSLDNLVNDMRAGFLTETFRQLLAAQAARREARAVAAVGDAFSLLMGCVASGWGRLPLFHLQPQISRYYWGERSTWERLQQPNQFGAEDYLFYERWMHQCVRAVYVRDRLSEARARQLGMHKARFVGGMAMDTLTTPERDLGHLTDGRPVLVLLPGTRDDVQFSLPMMLKSAALLPQMQGLVAWAANFDRVPLPEGWRLEVHSEQDAFATNGSTQVWLLRQAFSAILGLGKVAVGTAGTANEQAAGSGIPVVAFPTTGPQYLMPNALRQTRLLGLALKLVEARPEVIAAAVRERLENLALRAEALADGLERNGPRGALPQIAAEIKASLL
ncbi:MAG: lipid-A-disaccharide synthase-related protein [Meiothermus sp.]|nr:lipid-A-disaccharide synthase-related protein [Meiothermus sp.]